MRDGHLQPQRFSEARRERTSSGLIILIRRRSPEAECTNLLRLTRKAGEQALRYAGIKAAERDRGSALSGNVSCIT